MDKERIRVVIADDEPITRMDLRELLTEEGYSVVAEVADGFDAVENCKFYHPDLVLLDIKMPFLDGLSAAKIIYGRIWRTPSSCSRPTASGNSSNRPRAMG